MAISQWFANKSYRSDFSSDIRQHMKNIPSKNLKNSFDKIQTLWLRDEQWDILYVGNKIATGKATNKSLQFDFIHENKSISDISLDSFMAQSIDKKLIIDSFGKKTFESLNSSTTHCEFEIAAISSKESCEKKLYRRLLIPIEIDPVLNIYYSVKPYTHGELQNGWSNSLVEVSIQENSFAFYYIKSASQHWLCIDSNSPTEHKSYWDNAYSILLSHSLLSGQLFLKEGYFLSSENATFEAIDTLEWRQLGESKISGYNVITSNEYSYTKRTNDKNSEPILKRIDEEIFNRLCSFCQENLYIRYAINLILSGNLSDGILQPVAYSVALETITGGLQRNGKKYNLKTVEDSDWEVVRKDLLTVINSALLEEGPKKIFTTKVNNMNAPLNSTALSKPFEIAGLSLSDEDKQLIKKRNGFLHGNLSTPADTIENQAQYRFFESLRLHFLVCRLILKLVDYYGYTIDWSAVVKKKKWEEIHIKI